MDTDTDIDAELEEWRRQNEAAEPAREPLRPLVPEARWTSTDLAVELIATREAGIECVGASGEDEDRSNLILNIGPGILPGLTPV